MAAGADGRSRRVGACPRIAAPQLRDEGPGSWYRARALAHLPVQHSPFHIACANSDPVIVDIETVLQCSRRPTRLLTPAATFAVYHTHDVALLLMKRAPYAVALAVSQLHRFSDDCADSSPDAGLATSTACGPHSKPRKADSQADGVLLRRAQTPTLS